MGNMGRSALIWLVILLLLATLFNLFQGPKGGGPERDIAYSEFIQAVDMGSVQDVKISGDKITGVLSDSSRFTTFMPDDPTLVARLSSTRRHKFPFRRTYFMVPNVTAYSRMDFLHAANAGRWQRRRYGLWQVKSAAVNRASNKSYF